MKPINLEKKILHNARQRSKYLKQRIEELQKERKKEKSGTRAYYFLTREITRYKKWLEGNDRFLNGSFAKSVKSKTIKTQKQRKNK